MNLLELPTHDLAQSHDSWLSGRPLVNRKALPLQTFERQAIRRGGQTAPTDFGFEYHFNAPSRSPKLISGATVLPKLPTTSFPSKTTHHQWSPCNSRSMVWRYFSKCEGCAPNQQYAGCAIKVRRRKSTTSSKCFSVIGSWVRPAAWKLGIGFLTLNKRSNERAVSPINPKASISKPAANKCGKSVSWALLKVRVRTRFVRREQTDLFLNPVEGLSVTGT